MTVGTDPYAAGSACSSDPSACPATFGGLLRSLRDAPRSDDLLVSMDLTTLDGSDLTSSGSSRLGKVVEGSIQLPIEIH